MEAKVVMFQPAPRRSFWQKAHEGDDHQLLLIGIVCACVFLVATVLTAFFLNEITAELTANLSILVWIGMIADIVSFGLASYGVAVLIGQINERE